MGYRLLKELESRASRYVITKNDVVGWAMVLVIRALEMCDINFWPVILFYCEGQLGFNIVPNLVTKV
jgi:hypothetical protein